MSKRIICNEEGEGEGEIKKLKCIDDFEVIKQVKSIITIDERNSNKPLVNIAELRNYYNIPRYIVTEENLQHFKNKNFVTLQHYNHEYIINDKEGFNLWKDVKLTSASKISGSLYIFPAKTIATKIISSVKKNDKYDHFKQFPNGVELLMQHWTDIGKLAAQKGTLLHTLIENFFLHGQIDKDYEYGDDVLANVSIELKKFQYFFENYIKKNDLLPIQLEFSIIDRDYPIVGTFDSLFANYPLSYQGGGKLVVTMFDWKTCNKKKLDDKTYKKYELQQNIYKYILEKEKNQYNIVVKDMYLVIFNNFSDEKEYILRKVEHLLPIYVEHCIENALRGGSVCG